MAINSKNEQMLTPCFSFPYKGKVSSTDLQSGFCRIANPAAVGPALRLSPGCRVFPRFRRGDVSRQRGHGSLDTSRLRRDTREPVGACTTTKSYIRLLANLGGTVEWKLIESLNRKYVCPNMAINSKIGKHLRQLYLPL